MTQPAKRKRVPPKEAAARTLRGQGIEATGHQPTAKSAIPKSRKRSIVAKSKDAEREFAQMMGGKRLPSTGQPNKPDVDGGWWVMEVKHRRIPQWILDAMQQAALAAKGRKGAPLPLLGLKDKPGHGGKPVRYLLVMEPDTFVTWNGRGGDES